MVMHESCKSLRFAAAKKERLLILCRSVGVLCLKLEKVSVKKDTLDLSKQSVIFITFKFRTFIIIFLVKIQRNRY